MGESARPLLRLGAICLALAAPGCVLPIGPEFQDPPATQNFAPIILDAEPRIGARVITPSFRVTVQDPNVGDDLVVRFIADYPPLTDSTRQPVDVPIMHTTDGRLLAKDVSFTPTCNELAKVPSHQVTVIVADRAFLKVDAAPGQPTDPTRLPTDAGRIVGAWTLDLDCTLP